jgi:hypothetical protein
MDIFDIMNKKKKINRHNSSPMTTNSRTTVTLKDVTLERLTRYGEFGDSWDSLINKILDMLIDYENKTFPVWTSHSSIF